MDFPKSVAGIGLVGDRFIDENPVTGQQGSLIAAAWGNQVTDELLNVMVAARKISDTPDDLEPSEDKSDQLLTAIQTLITGSIPASLSGWGDITDKPIAINAITSVLTINTTGTLGNEQLGLILIDASASDVALTLPTSTLSNKGARVRFIRVDNSSNKVTIKAATGETILFNMNLRASGYGFFYLFGAGDYWELASSALGTWVKTGCLDTTPVGGVSYNASALTPVGGSLVASGTLLSRTEYPWLWDFAVQSGLLVDAANAESNDGCFTTGDGATTFRIPDLRGLFLRAYDNGRGKDVGRVIGSFQDDALQNIKGSLTPAMDGRYRKTSGAFSWQAGTSANYLSAADVSGGVLNFDASRVARTATETRPMNVSYPVYIKII